MKIPSAETQTSPPAVISPVVRILRPSTDTWRPVTTSSSKSGVGG
jgi:hypothetical protein